MRRVSTLWSGLVLSGVASAATVTVFSEDFENPSGLNLPNGLDVSTQSINTLYGVAFQQTFTVETLAINGPAGTFSDPSGIGGDYALGMLSGVQNDLFSITFNTEGRRFVNIFFDLSSIDLPGLGGPFTQDNASVPVVEVSVRNTPGGAFNIGQAGAFALLGSGTATGVASPRFVFDWTSQSLFIDAAGSTDGVVTVVFDLLQGGYASLDNIVIRSSDVPAPGAALPLAMGLCVARRRRRPGSASLRA